MDAILAETSSNIAPSARTLPAESPPGGNIISSEPGTEACNPTATLGRVVSVSGSRIVVLLSEARSSSAGSSQLPIGALIKIRTSGSTVFGMVSGLSIPIPERDSPREEMKIVEVELLGEAVIGSENRPEGFKRGVSFFPALGDDVLTASSEDLAQVYACPDKSTVQIGTIHQERALPASVIVDDLLGRHFAIVGTTGSGKSCAVTLLLRRILSKYPHAHIVLLDPHNEYKRAFGEMAEVLGPQTLHLPFWLFNFEEIAEVVVGSNEAEAAEAMILSELIPTAKRQFAGLGNEASHITVDTPLPYFMQDIIELIDEIIGKLDRPQDLNPYRRLKSRITTLQSDSRFAFMFGRVPRKDEMADILARIFRIPDNGKPVTIIDLSGVPSEVVNVTVSVLSRVAFDFGVWSNGLVPILLVCEEAHRYAPQDDRLGFEPAKRALARIAKEGRKYGVSLGLVSQRPSELATSVLAECNTIFAMRLSNQKDQEFVRASVSESGLGLLDALPSLRNSEAIVIGEGVPVPMRLCFDELPDATRPISGTASFSAAWQADINGYALIEEVVQRWRNQRR